ncbi:hypothetical protein ACIRU2_05740 [Streptomyces sp. NPDC101169]|uniref:hypothetical protein n=1 Tax=Streptomyces sp. NPDC101169 TaxID=3366121 RepID=UPI00381820D4
MAWDEWEQLKTEAVTRQQGDATHMRLNQLPADPGGGPIATPSQPGDLKVTQHDLAKIGSQAHTLYTQLRDRARLSNTSVDSAAGDLTTQGFALGSGLQHVSNKWDQQLNSLLDACAHISNHMQVTKKISGRRTSTPARRPWRKPSPTWPARSPRPRGARARVLEQDRPDRVPQKTGKA